jgi:4-aminobutyrate aminotransferase
MFEENTMKDTLRDTLQQENLSATTKITDKITDQSPAQGTDDSLRRVPGPKAQALIARDAEVMSPSYTRDYPFVMAHGRGAEAWDVDGNRFVDFTSGIAVTATGHSHPEVVRAIQEQAEKFLHMSGTDFYYEPQIELAEKLASIAPFSEPARVFFSNSGTEAIEAALKLARYTTGRPRILAFIGSFHGRTMGSLGATGSKYVQRKGFYLMGDGVTHVPYADSFRPILNMDGFSDYGERVVDYIEHTLFRTIVPPHEVAGILVEAIQGEGGYVVPTPGFFPALRELCNRYGILLIADEVQAGIGRTGKWWGIQHFGVEPDIVATAKGIASGMPLGAMIARKRLMTWAPGAHASTFGGNPLSCAAANATLRVIENGLLDNAHEMGEYLKSHLISQVMPRHPHIGDVRGIGLMVGVDFVTDHQTRGYNRALRDLIVQRAFDEGLLLLGCGVSAIRLIPSLDVTRALCDEALELFDRAITRAESELA